MFTSRLTETAGQPITELHKSQKHLSDLSLSTVPLISYSLEENELCTLAVVNMADTRYTQRVLKQRSRNIPIIALPNVSKSPYIQLNSSETT
jgi:hypothetical protein